MGFRVRAEMSTVCCSRGLTNAAFHRCGCEAAVRLTSVALARASSMRVTCTLQQCISSAC